MKTAQKGYRIVYEPDAYAMESPSFSIKDEKKRKIRIAAGGFQAIGILAPLLAFWKTPKLSFVYISHRLLRWTLSPLCIILLLVSNLALSLNSGQYIYKILFSIQLLFYFLAFLPLIPGMKRFNFLKLPYYFIFMNLSVIQGFFRFINGKQPATWEKARRQTTII